MMKMILKKRNERENMLNFRNVFPVLKYDKQISSYEEEVEVHSYNKKFENLDLEMKNFFSQGDGLSYQKKCQRNHSEPTLNRLAFPQSFSEYFTYQDPLIYKFFVSLYSRLSSIGFSEPKLLINFSLSFPSVFQADFYCLEGKKNKNLYSRMFSIKDRMMSHLRWRVLNTEAHQIKIKAHKSTSAGPPFVDYLGNPVSRSDFLYGTEIEWGDPSSHLRMDQSKLKKDLVEHRLKGVFESALELCEKPFSFENVIKGITSACLNQAVSGRRSNNMDSIINLEPGQPYSGRALFGKHRKFLRFEENKIITGKFNTEKFSNDFKDYFPMAFSPHRIRIILSCSFLASLASQILAQMLMKVLEDSKSGFVSSSNLIKDCYQAFLTNLNPNDDIMFINADRSNADSYISNNFDDFFMGIPTEIKNLFDYFSHCVYWTKKGPRMLYGLQTGEGLTTFKNTIGGDESGCLILSTLTGIPFDIVYDEICNCRELSKDYVSFEKQGYYFTNFLPTDNNIIVVIKKNGFFSTEDEAKLKALEEENSLNIEISKESTIGFGMELTKTGIFIAQSSLISKLLYDEKPGYGNEHCFGIYSKLLLVDPQIKMVVERTLNEVLGISTSFFDSQASEFLLDLQRLGITVDETLSVYSPSARIIAQVLKEKGVSNDPISGENNVPFEHYDFIFNYFKERMEKKYDS